MDKEKFSGFFDGKAINRVARDAVITTRYASFKKKKALRKISRLRRREGDSNPDLTS